MSRSILIKSLVGVAVGIAVGAAPALAAGGPKPPKEPKGQFTKPPKGAVVLFDGKDASGWLRVGGKGAPHQWKVEDGAFVCDPRKGSVLTKQKFGDQKLHIEFRTPHMPDASKGSQARGNSGVYLQGRYEIQVLDSYGLDRPIQNDDCGALYKLITPSYNACLPPNEWQSYDITFHAPKFDKSGKKMIKKGRLTVVQNGITIIDDKEIPGTTAGGVDDNPKKRGTQYDVAKPGPLMLQDHGNTVAFRNIWVVPLK